MRRLPKRGRRRGQPAPDSLFNNRSPEKPPHTCSRVYNRHRTLMYHPAAREEDQGRVARRGIKNIAGRKGHAPGCTRFRGRYLFEGEIALRSLITTTEFYRCRASMSNILIKQDCARENTSLGVWGVYMVPVA